MSSPDTNPYKSPATKSGDSSKNLLPAIPLIFFGIFVGTISFAQMVSCVGYYVGGLLHGFERQPPVRYVILDGLLGLVAGFLFGGRAGLQISRGQRPRLSVVGLVCLVNTAALLGTIEIAFDFSWESLTLRTAMVGIISGAITGAILSLLIYNGDSGIGEQ